MNLKNISFFSGILFFLLFLNLTSCKSDKKVESELFDKAIINNLDIDETIKWVIVLPGLGCKGCIRETELFMKENIGKQEIIFVLTKIHSLKILKQKIGTDIEVLPNVFIDKNNVFIGPTNNSIYPCLIKLHEGEIVTHEFQSPKNAKAFLQLKSQIK